MTGQEQQIDPRHGFVSRGGYDRAQGLASVGLGWAGIVGAVFDRLPADVSIEQVKEKFGHLRIYCAGAGWAAFHEEVIVPAEAASAATCEKCGKPGVLRYSRPGGMWLKTLCDDEGGSAPLQR